MQKHVTFLHTSPLHVVTFEALMRIADPDVQVEHAVHEVLLADAQRSGAEEPSLVARVQDAMSAAAASGSSLVICTCSTIGGAAERTATGGRFSAIRIDRAMADRAVRQGPRILVVAALESTLAPTSKLLQESAAALGTAIELEYLVPRAAWPIFQRGDRAGYVDEIVSAVRAACPSSVDVVVLAQASMSPAARVLAQLGIDALCSPELGIQDIVERLRQ